MSDPVRVYLRRQGYAAYIVEGGVDYLLEDWESLVEAIRCGEIPNLGAYVHGLDRRRMLDEVLALIPLYKQAWYHGRVFEADAALRAHVEATDIPLCGEEVAEENGYSPERHWWYYHRPKQAASTWHHAA